jgi:hypothetical protein
MHRSAATMGRELAAVTAGSTSGSTQGKRFNSILFRNSPQRLPPVLAPVVRLSGLSGGAGYEQQESIVLFRFDIRSDDFG